MKNKYRCIFFDLDHTLWDYEANSRETLEHLYAHYDLQRRGVPDLEQFCIEFKRVNTELWHLYDHGKITSEIIREQRFKQILGVFNAYEEKLSQALSHDYLHDCPKRGNLIPHAHEILEQFSALYSLTIITNGFEEIQNMKLTSGNLHGYFDHVITSQKAGCKKPAREIFDYALSQNKARAHEAIMIGDNLATDIAGAHNAGVDAVFFNPEGVEHNTTVKYEVRTLKELAELI